jgi:hypothetical protein
MTILDAEQMLDLIRRTSEAGDMLARTASVAAHMQARIGSSGPLEGSRTAKIDSERCLEKFERLIDRMVAAGLETEAAEIHQRASSRIDHGLLVAAMGRDE